MNADDHPGARDLPAATGEADAASQDDPSTSSVAAPLRDLLVAHVDDGAATDAVWAEIVRGAGARRAARTRRRAVAVALLAAAAVLVAVLVVRIDAARDEGAQVVTEPEPVTDPTDGTEPGSWVRLLAHVPDVDVEDQVVSVFDLARARRDAGIEVLPPNPSEAEWSEHSMGTFGHPDILTYAFGTGVAPEELRAELGISPEQFDQVVTYNPRPGLNRYVALGRFDPDAIAAAVAADPQWSPMLEVREHRGVTYYRWGDDLRLYRKSPARVLGNGGRLVVGDGWVSWTLTDAEAEATIDTSIDPAVSLATVGPLRSSAEDADALGLTQMTLTRVGSSQLVDANVSSPGSGVGSGTDVGGASAPGPLPGMAPIDLPQTWWFGAAGTDVDVVRYGLGYPNPEQAAANLEAYGQSWRRFATDAEVEVQRAGSSVVATLHLPAVEGDLAPGQVSDGAVRRSAGTFLRYFEVRR